MKTHHNIALSAIALATKIALATFTLSSAVQASENKLPRVTASNYNININADNLANCIYNVAEQAGIYISADISLTKNKQCQPMTTTANIESILTQLLTPFDLVAIAQSPGRYAVQKVQQTRRVNTLATAIIQSDDLKDGSAEDGYISDGVANVSIWQGRKLQDTPYSINVISEDLLQNLQATSTDQVFKINPLIQVNRPQAQNNEFKIFSRGFATRRASRNGVFLDRPDHGASMQEVEQVEVLTGLSGFLYGAGNIGGMVNYVTKRPTEERLNSVTVGNTSGSNVYLHGDFGGQIDQEGKFGYRFNVLTQDGETATKDQDLELNFASFAFDWRVNDSLLIQIDGSDRDYHMKGLQTGWSLGDDEFGEQAIRPSAKQLDSDLLWSQKWAIQDSQNQRLATNLFWDIDENLSLRAGYLADTTDRYYTSADSTINADGTYTQYAETDKASPSRKAYTWGSFIFIDIDFNTGDIAHKMVTGLRFSDKERNDGNNAWSNGVELGPFSLAKPGYVDEPNWQYDGEYSPYLLSKTTTSNFSIGDDITFNEQWSALVGLAYSSIEDKRYNGDTTLRTHYDESALTPSLSIIYKPIDSVTTYISYMEGLEDGDHADDRHQGLEVINAGESFKPLTSTQLELGAKANMNGMLFAAALFEIEKPLEYYLLKEEKYEFVQDGRQLHRGLEFTATGKLTENLTLVGGFTLLDAKIKEQRAQPELEGNRPDEVAKQMFKFYGEYAIPAISGLVINGSLSHTGSFYSELDNKEELDGYTLTDIGARYTFNNLTNPVTLRFNISNLTDKRYWANGSYTGDGRRMALSANVEF